MTKHIIVIGGGLGGISAAIRMAQSWLFGLII